MANYFINDMNTSAVDAPATIASVSASSVDSSQSASASLSGPPSSRTIAFNIPRGANGSQPTFAIGTVSTLAAGSSATVSISTGTTTTYRLNFGIPRGPQGPPGPSGGS